MVRLGVCMGIEHARMLAKAGFDYIEPALNGIAALREEEYRSARAEIDAAGIACEAFNCMLPGEIKVTGPEVNEGCVRKYLALAFHRAAELGGKTVVFGSGASRAVPEGCSHAEAWRQLEHFLALAEEYAERENLVIALEPLDRQECNILNYVTEATLLASLVNLPQIGVLADTYHMHRCREPLTAITQTGGLLRHIHMAEPTKRVFPKPGDGQDYGELFRVLKCAGFDGRVSIEAGAAELERDVAEAFSLLDPLRRG